jgi:DNA-binding MarR family transcriptional regulator
MLQSELARLILTRPQSIGAVLTRLEDERWVTRQRGPSGNHIAEPITDSGRSILAATHNPAAGCNARGPGTSTAREQAGFLFSGALRFFASQHSATPNSRAGS